MRTTRSDPPHDISRLSQTVCGATDVVSHVRSDANMNGFTVEAACRDLQVVVFQGGSDFCRPLDSTRKVLRLGVRIAPFVERIHLAGKF